MICLQIAKELVDIVHSARKAPKVHLAGEALPGMPCDAASYINTVEHTASSVRQLASSYDELCR